MQSFSIAELQALAPGDVHYHEFLRRPSLSLGLYSLPAGAEDPQAPHRQDEVYVVLAGKATFQSGDRYQPVIAGDILYVPALEPHKFSEIEESLSLIVFFAPAEDDG